MESGTKINRFLRHSWILVLIGTSLASLGAYSYFSGLNAEFIRSEVAHRSELLAHDIREIIQQHIDATEGMTAYVRAELSAHQSIVELDEARELLRGTLAAHSGELLQAYIFPPDTSRVVSDVAADGQAPPVVWSDVPGLAPDELRLATVQSGQGYLLLRLFQSVCVQKVCGYTVTDLNTHNLIHHALESAGRNQLNFDLYVKVGLIERSGEETLYIQSGSRQARNGASWDGGFELLGSQFAVYTSPSPALRHHLSSHAADWVLALGLLLGLLLSHLAYNRSRYGETLRLTVAKRTHELSDEQQKLAAVIDHAAESILVMDADGAIRRANPAACELFGYQPDEWQGHSVHDLVPEKIREQHIQWFAEEISGKRHDMLGKTRELRARRKDGSIFPCEVTVTGFEAAGQRRLSVILRDLTEQKRAEERLIQLSYYDELTGLANRRLFSDRLEQTVSSESGKQGRLAVFYMGLARFAAVNETMGHRVGDAILTETARRLEGILRESGAAAARMDNHVFAVLLPETEAERAADMAEQIRQAMHRPFHVHEQEISMGANLGVALFPDDGANAEILIRHAATAMGHAKRDDLSIHFFSSDMEKRMERRLSMEQELTRAASGGQLKLYYQSQHGLTGPAMTSPFPLHYQSKRQLTDGLPAGQVGPIIGVESLVRWQHPALGTISPAEFIPLAEETGLIQSITRWVLAEAARQAVDWEKAGIRPQRIGVNISAVQLMQKDLAQEILTRIKEAGARPEWIEIEITETAAMRDPDTAVNIMRQLADAGISLAIDDYGTGYSSLAYLKRMPAEWLKIDIAFIRGLPDDDEDAAIVRSTIAMAHSLGMKTIAEGVETDAQLEFLKGEGCDAVQGYLLSKPLPADEATAHIRRSGDSIFIYCS